MVRFRQKALDLARVIARPIAEAPGLVRPLRLPRLLVLSDDELAVVQSHLLRWRQDRRAPSHLLEECKDAVVQMSSVGRRVQREKAPRILGNRSLKVLDHNPHLSR
jgi:hypothetical protein